MSDNSMSIPDIRDRLREIAEDTGNDELAYLADPMYRRKLKETRAPVTSQKMTPELAAEMRKHLNRNPSASNQEVADHYNVNPGRVSDALEKS